MRFKKLYLSTQLGDLYGREGYQSHIEESEDERSRKDLWKVAARKGFDYVDNIVHESPDHRWNDHDVEFGYRDGFIAGVKWKVMPEWSEDDEKLLDFWLDVIDRNDWRMDENFCKASREFINRLKSLSPQAKQEWNEEDEEMFDAFMHKLEVCDLLTNKEVMWVKLRLKSLHPQPRQEWSEKEKKMLAVISYKISQHQGNDERSLFTPDEAEFIDGMEDKLKSLRPDSYKNCNSQWKPSEEQMEVLRRALRINPASGKLHYLKENEVCILQGLLKQLEKL